MNLEKLQREMASAVMLPLTADEQMRSHAPDGRTMAAVAESFIAPNSRLSSFERLEIYNRQYWFRVLGAVSEDFPALRAVIGARRFDTLALAYLREHPSGSWTLRDLGARLPEFLEAYPALAGRRHRLAVDVARLEWAYVEAFDAVRREPLTPDELAGIGPETRFALQPHVRLLALRYPLDELVLAVHKATPESDVVSNAVQERAESALVMLPRMRPQRVYLAVHRYEDSVYYRRIARESYVLLGALRDGVPLGNAISGTFAGLRISAARQAELIRATFEHASTLGWLCARKQELGPG